MAIALVMLYIGFNYLKGIDFFSSSNKYYAIYDNVDQLTVSNPVLVNGFAVGRVSEIKILQNRGNRVLVEIDIDSDIVLGDSARAILDSDFLGNKSILLNLGNTAKPISPGDTIIAEAARGIIDVFAETAEPVASNVQTTLRKLNTVLDNVALSSLHLDTLMIKLKYTPYKVNKVLDSAALTMGDVSSDFRRLTDNLNLAIRDLRPTLANFRSLSDSLKRAEIVKTIKHADQTLMTLNESLARLKSTDNSMGKLLNEDSLYVNLNTLILNLDTLANHFNAYPKHFMSPLGKSKKKIERDLNKEADKKEPNN